MKRPGTPILTVEPVSSSMANHFSESQAAVIDNKINHRIVLNMQDVIRLIIIMYSPLFPIHPLSITAQPVT